MLTIMPAEERYVRPTLGGWLRPLVLGSFLSAYVSSAVYAFVFQGGWLGPWITLGIGLVLATVWAATYSLLLATIDLLLLAFKLRRLPTGWSAWTNTAGSAVLVHAVYFVVKPHSFYKTGVWGILLALLIPMIVGAFAARLVGGKPVR